VPGDHRRELLEQLVDPQVALGGQRGDGTGQIVAVVVRQGRNSNPRPGEAGLVPVSAAAAGGEKQGQRHHEDDEAEAGPPSSDFGATSLASN
jgi:hypothetical protein